MAAKTKVVNLRGVPDDLIRRAKAVAAFNGMTLKAFIIECLEQRLEREGGWVAHAPCPEEPAHLIPTRLGDGWRCSKESCSWEVKRRPGLISPGERQWFDKDAEERFAQHLAHCPIQKAAGD